ncbi:hypothetical protein [Bacillus toyonensis]|uniref:DUF4315 family protein n=1 Tax=Bacillus toyonensis TaxID=155322 RepID=A0A2A8HD72_9BACI|nr:hypothetical protein [Bacillus toyonensis]PEQ04857.1 hypothetical protein CN585_16685 [Bacillus toyonensis]
MLERIKKIEERISSRKQKIEKLQDGLKSEKNKLKKDQDILFHLKYDDILTRIQETGFSPNELLRVIDNEVEKNQKHTHFLGDNQNNSHNREGI